MIFCLLKEGSKSFIVLLLGGKPRTPINFGGDKDNLGTGYLSLTHKVNESTHLSIVILLNLKGGFHAVAVKADKEDPIVEEK